MGEHKRVADPVADEALKRAVAGETLLVHGAKFSGKTDLLVRIRQTLGHATLVSGSDQLAADCDSVSLYTVLSSGFDWSAVQVLLLDDVQMMDSAMFHRLDEAARVGRNKQSFGGLQIVAAGDFLQPRKSSALLFDDPLWKELFGRENTLRLVMDHVHDPATAQMLGRLRLGRPSDQDMEILKKRIVRTNGVSMDPAIHAFATRDIVDWHNAERFGMLTSPAREFPVDLLLRSGMPPPPSADMSPRRLKGMSSALPDSKPLPWSDSIKGKPSPSVTKTEAKAEAKASGLEAKDPPRPSDKWLHQGPRTLTLAVGARVALSRTLAIEGSDGGKTGSSLPRGSLGTVDCFVGPTSEAWPKVRFDAYGSSHIVKRQMYSLGYGDHVSEIPLQQAFAVTFRALQDLPGVLPRLATALDTSCYCEGQAYMAVAKVRRIEDLVLLDLDKRAFRSSARAAAFDQDLIDLEPDPTSKKRKRKTNKSEPKKRRRGLEW